MKNFIIGGSNGDENIESIIEIIESYITTIGVKKSIGHYEAIYPRTSIVTVVTCSIYHLIYSLNQTLLTNGSANAQDDSSDISTRVKTKVG